MCGRYAFALNTLGRWKAVFTMLLEGFDMKYNIAPSTMVPVFTRDGWQMMRWGLVPAWSKDGKTKYATFNARAESLTEKPLFRQPWKNEQRCLIPVSGYYEWCSDSGDKQPYFIHSSLDEPLVFAGLWEKWQNDLESFFSCTIITTRSADELSKLHHRMPVMLEPDQAEDWLKGDIQRAMQLLERATCPDVRYHQVSKDVGNPRNQGANLIVPVSSEIGKEL